MTIKLSKLLQEDKIDQSLSEIVEYLRRDIYPKLSDNEVYELNQKLKIFLK